MKEFFFIKDSITNRISFFHLAFFLAALPFDRIYSELAVISLLVHTLIHLNRRKLSVRNVKNTLAPSAIYLVACFGTIYSAHHERAFFEWEILLSLIIFPFFFSVSSFDAKRYTIPLLLVLGLSCVFTTLYLYINAFRSIAYNHLPTGMILSPAFINHNFSQPIDLHATYFSMYIAISIPLFVYLFINNKHTGSRVFCVGCVLILVTGLLQLASRSVLLAVFLIHGFIFPFFLATKKIRHIYSLVFLIASLIIGAVIAGNNTLRDRYVSGLRNDLSDTIINVSSLEPRRVRWDCAFSLIKQSPVFGHGSGSEIPLLKDLYFSRGYYQSYLHELNSHNQYLGILVETGVAGLFVFLWVLYQGTSAAVRNRNIFFVSFLVIVFIVCFSENILSANKTIFFFAFFISLFMSSEKPIQK